MSDKCLRKLDDLIKVLDKTNDKGDIINIINYNIKIFENLCDVTDKKINEIMTEYTWILKDYIYKYDNMETIKISEQSYYITLRNSKFFIGTSIETDNLNLKIKNIILNNKILRQYYLL